MKIEVNTVEEYLAELPPDRRDAIQAVRQVILKNLPGGYEEGIQYGMIGYYVPHSIYPAGYHCDPRQPLPFAALASQKNYMSLYLMCVYGAPEHENWFRDAWLKTGKKLNMGKSCVRFKKIDDVPLDVIGKAVKRVPVKKFIEHYEAAIKNSGRHAAKSRKPKPQATATGAKRKSSAKPPATDTTKTSKAKKKSAASGKSKRAT